MNPSERPGRGYVLALLALGGLLLVPRLLHLDTFVNVDGCAHWFGRSLSFYKALWQGDLAGTLVSGHPGVTIMLMSGMTVIAAGVVKFQTLSLVPYFADLLFWAKLPIAIATAAAVLSVVRILRRHHGSMLLALCAGLFLALDPLYLAHSRFLQLDAITSVCMLLCIVWLAIYARSDSRRHLAASGVFAGLAVLTKSYAGALAPFALVAILLVKLCAGGERRLRSFALDTAYWCAAAGAVFVLLWPAMWVSPVETLLHLARAAGFAMTHLHENLGPGASGLDHAVINQAIPAEMTFRGERVTNLFGRYSLLPLVLALVPVATLLGRRAEFARERTLVVCLFSFAVFFSVGMSFLGKSGPRYMIVVCLILDVLAAVGLYQLLTFFAMRSDSARVKIAARTSLAAVVVITALSVFAVHPYYGTYRNGVFDTGYLGWGEGLDQVARHFREKPHYKSLTIASFYPCILKKLGGCNTVQLEKMDEMQVDYVVLYKGQVDREMYPHVIKTYLRDASQQPEFIARIRGVEYAWVYRALPFGVWSSGAAGSPDSTTVYPAASRSP